MVVAVATVALAWPAAARAERVVVLRATGPAPAELRNHVEEALASAVTAAGFEAVTEFSAVQASAEPPPTTANELRAVAEMQGAAYVVTSEVTALEGGYRLHVRAGYAPLSRVEELDLEIATSREAERLGDILAALLRPEGVGADAVRLAEETLATARAEHPEPAPTTAEEEAEREAFAARERERAHAAWLAEEARWQARERYGDEAPWLASAAVDLRPVLFHDPARTGGVLGGLSLRVGRALPFLRGLEGRAAVDLTFGAANGFALAAGAAYLTSPFVDTPFFFGGALEAGLFFGTSGNRVGALLVRGGPVLAWRPAARVYLEACLPELMLLTSNGGVGTLGLSVRVGYRF